MRYTILMLLLALGGCGTTASTNPSAEGILYVDNGSTYDIAVYANRARVATIYSVRTEVIHIRSGMGPLDHIQITVVPLGGWANYKGVAIAGIPTNFVEFPCWKVSIDDFTIDTNVLLSLQPARCRTE